MDYCNLLVLILLEEKLYKAPYPKGLSSGKEPLQGQGCGSIFIYFHTPLKIIFLLHTAASGKH